MCICVCDLEELGSSLCGGETGLGEGQGDAVVGAEKRWKQISREREGEKECVRLLILKRRQIHKQKR